MRQERGEISFVDVESAEQRTTHAGDAIAYLLRQRSPVMGIRVSADPSLTFHIGKPNFVQSLLTPELKDALQGDYYYRQTITPYHEYLDAYIGSITHTAKGRNQAEVTAEIAELEALRDRPQMRETKLSITSDTAQKFILVLVQQEGHQPVAAISDGQGTLKLARDEDGAWKQKDSELWGEANQQTFDPREVGNAAYSTSDGASLLELAVQVARTAEKPLDDALREYDIKALGSLKRLDEQRARGGSFLGEGRGIAARLSDEELDKRVHQGDEAAARLSSYHDMIRERKGRTIFSFLKK